MVLQIINLNTPSQVSCHLITIISINRFTLYSFDDVVKLTTHLAVKDHDAVVEVVVLHDAGAVQHGERRHHPGRV